MESATQLLTEHLDTWTATVHTKSSAGRGGGKKRELYGIKKLRELILELAVRGLLVPQDPNDEPASGAINRCQPAVLPPISNEDKSTPTGWTRTQLGCVIESNIGGGTPSKSNPNYWNGGIPWASVKDIQFNKYFNTTIDQISQDGLDNSSSNLIPTGTLIVVTRMGLGKLSINQKPVAINQDLRAITPSKAIDIDYAYLLFKNIKFEGKGVTVKGVTVKKLNATSILLPPLAEQQRIVAKVDELMGLCDRLEQQQSDHMATHELLVNTLLDALVAAASDAEQWTAAWQRIAAHFDALFTTEASIDQLKQTILQLAVMGKLVEQDAEDEPAGELLKKIATEKERLVKEKKIKKQKKLPEVAENRKGFAAPEGWAWDRLANVYDVRDGTHDTPKYFDSGIPLITSKNISSGSLKFDDVKFISEEDHEKIAERSKVDRHDILFAMIGSIGNPVMVLTDDIFSIKNVALFKYFTRSLSSPDYLLLFLKYAENVFREEASGAVQSFVSLGKIRGFEICLPPLAEQHRIVAKVDELMALCDALKAKLCAAQATQRTLTDSLVEQAVG